MPRGKMPIVGFIATRADLDKPIDPHLSLLKKARDKKAEKLSDTAWKQMGDDVVSIVEQYLGATISAQKSWNKIPTLTEQIKLFTKVRKAASALEADIASESDSKAARLELIKALSINELGAHTKKAINSSLVFFRDGVRTGDIFDLEQSLRSSRPLSSADRMTLNKLRQVADPQKPPKGEQSDPNPLWQRFLLQMVVVWMKATGRKAGPAYSMKRHKIDFPFFRWITAVLEDVNRNHNIELPGLLPTERAARTIVTIKRTKSSSEK